MPETLTADDFTMKYDATHDFPFIETEDAVIMAWGHDDDEALLDQVFEYDKLCDPKYAERGDAAALAHRWAVRLDPERDDDPEMWWIKWAGDDGAFTESTPGAFAVTIWSR